MTDVMKMQKVIVKKNGPGNSCRIVLPQWLGWKEGDTLIFAHKMGTEEVTVIKEER